MISEDSLLTIVLVRLSQSTGPITLEIQDSIDRLGSFAKAAEELNKATSALSYGVQKLEDQLGLSIFVRQGRRSVLTPAGRPVHRVTDGTRQS